VSKPAGFIPCDLLAERCLRSARLHRYRPLAHRVGRELGVRTLKKTLAPLALSWMTCASTVGR